MRPLKCEEIEQQSPPKAEEQKNGKIPQTSRVSRETRDPKEI